MKPVLCSLLSWVAAWFCCPVLARPSDSAYARHLVDTLSAPVFFGRGYVKSGMTKAAGFIEQEMQRWSLKPVGKSFRQPFQYPVNIFDGVVRLVIDGTTLVPGRDFLVSNESRAAHTAGTLVPVDSITWQDPRQEVIIRLADKLTWDVADHQADVTSFRVRKTALNKPPRYFETRVDARLDPAFRANNLIGMVKGTSRPDSFIVFTAHYDHVGGMGTNTYFPGANDNASGVALLLLLARYYAKHPAPYSIVFMAFAGEEIGLLGSAYFVAHPLIPLERIRFLTNLDLVGNGEEGITVVNATKFPAEFDRLQKINADTRLLPVIYPRGEARNSDHYWFTQKEVPSFFIYTLGPRKAYHDVEDVAATLSNVAITDLQKLLIRFTSGLTAPNRAEKMSKRLFFRQAGAAS